MNVKFKIYKHEEIFHDSDFHRFIKYLGNNGIDFNIYDVWNYRTDSGADGQGELIGEYDTLEQAREIYNELEPFIEYSSGYNKHLHFIGYMLTEEYEGGMDIWESTEWKDNDNPIYVEEME